MIDNAVAVGNAGLVAFDHPNAVYIPDRDIRNPEVMKLVQKMIATDKPVCMLPMDFPKDLNDAMQQGFTKNEIMDIIKQNTYHGLSAMVHYMKWSKVERKYYEFSENRISKSASWN